MGINIPKETPVNAGQNILEVGQNKMELVDFRLFSINEQPNAIFDKIISNKSKAGSSDLPDPSRNDGSLGQQGSESDKSGYSRESSLKLSLEEYGDEINEGIYGINVAKVIEIIKMPEDISEVPNSNEFIEGMFNLRGFVVPLVNLPKWMGLAEPENLKKKNFKVIITEFNKVKVGFIVHETTRIRRVSWVDINKTELSSVSQEDSKVTGIIKIENDDLLLLLDFESIVDELGFYKKEISEIDAEKKEITSDINVLIIDDSSTARKMINNALLKEGFKTIMAENGKEALDIVYSGKYTINAIICDVEMPVMDGYTFTKTMKADDKYKDIPIIMHTSLSGTENESKGKSSGADLYIVKFDPIAFNKAIKTVLKTALKSD
jgi:two-component system chemotaxis response regulator CheV